MKSAHLKAIKLQTADLASCEAFFTSVFGFEVRHRYGGGHAPFEEIVLTLGGDYGAMLKFIQQRDGSAAATGATIQIRLDDIRDAVAAASAAGAVMKLPPTDYPEAGVCMAVISTDQGLDIELVHLL